MFTFIKASSHIQIEKLKRKFKLMDILNILELEKLYKDTFIGFTPYIYYNELTEDIEYFKYKYGAVFINKEVSNLIYEFKYDDVSFYCLGG